MNLLLVIYSLSCGGAERVLSTLANAWAELGYTLSVATLDSNPPFYPVSSSVRLYPLKVASQSETGAVSAVLGNVRRVAALRQCIRSVNPDLVVSFMTPTNVLAILAARGCEVPVIVCEHTDPRHQNLNLAWSALRLVTYPFADAVTFLTSNVLRRWESWLAGKARLMPNPVSIDAACPPAILSHPRNLIAAGRLIHLKGFDMLIEAFGIIAARHPDWGLTIIGEGGMRSQLERQIQETGLARQVQLPGRMTNPHAWFAQADVFVLSSRYEGLPCSLCEAMACGTPAISFDCESGPADVIRDGVDGVLVPPGNVGALASALDELMTNQEARERMGLRAVEVQQRFGTPQILDLWDRLFSSLGVEVS